MTRLVAISDTHGSHGLLDIPEADVLVHCGDACARGRWAELEACLRWMAAQPCTHHVFVPGNHDGPAQLDAPRRWRRSWAFTCSSTPR